MQGLTGSQIIKLAHLLAILLISAVAFASSNAGHLTFQNTLNKGMDGGYYLEIALTNDGKEPLSISGINLPWAADNWDSWIKAFKLDNKQSQLEPGGALIDYGGQLQINPKESLKGRVPLHAMFRALLKDIDAYGVLIVCRCPSDLVPVTCSKPTTRFVVSKAGIKTS